MEIPITPNSSFFTKYFGVVMRDSTGNAIDSPIARYFQLFVSKKSDILKDLAALEYSIEHRNFALPSLSRDETVVILTKGINDIFSKYGYKFDTVIANWTGGIVTQTPKIAAGPPGAAINPNAPSWLSNNWWIFPIAGIGVIILGYIVVASKKKR